MNREELESKNIALKSALEETQISLNKLKLASEALVKQSNLLKQLLKKLNLENN